MVPFNEKLSLLFNGHINVESCVTLGSVKYINKYVNKSADMTFGRKIIEFEALPDSRISSSLPQLKVKVGGVHHWVVVSRTAVLESRRSALWMSRSAHPCPLMNERLTKIFMASTNHGNVANYMQAQNTLRCFFLKRMWSRGGRSRSSRAHASEGFATW